MTKKDDRRPKDFEVKPVEFTPPKSPTFNPRGKIASTKPKPQYKKKGRSFSKRPKTEREKNSAEDFFNS